MYIYIYIYLYTRSFKDPNNCRSSEKKTSFFAKKRVFVKNPYFGFCWICTNLSASGGPVSNFSSLHVAISYWRLLKSVRQNARSKLSKRYHTLCARSPPAAVTLPPMLRTFPSAGLEVVKKSLWIRMEYQRLRLKITPIICVVSFLSGSGNYRFDLAKRQAEP